MDANDITEKIKDLDAISTAFIQVLREKNIPPKLAVLVLASTLRGLPVIIKDREVYNKLIAQLMVANQTTFDFVMASIIEQEHNNNNNN